MQTIVTALEEQHAELAALLDGLDDRDWERPTRCEGWAVADVVLHLAQTDELALASARGRFAAGLDVSRVASTGRATSTTAPWRSWRANAGAGSCAARTVANGRRRLAW